MRRALTVAVVHPDLLGTYADGGNGLVLEQRARWRGVDARLVQAPSGERLPDADVYCIGGGEDAAQSASAERLRAEGRLNRAVDDGACVLSVCAGYQIAGHSFEGADGRARSGLGLLDAVSARGAGRRSVGELLAGPLVTGPLRDARGGAGAVLTGFENHAGLTTLGAVPPLASVVVGVGNGDGTEGACSGRVIGTYLHGPVLARNPALADLLLRWATGEAQEPLDDAAEDALRAERIAAVRLRPQRRWSRSP